MVEPEERWQMPWGVLLPIVGLGGAILTIYGLVPELEIPWPGRLAALGIALAAFFILRWLQAFGWGLLAGLVLPIHPLIHQAARSDAAGLLGEALALLILAAAIGAWQIAFRSRFAWRSWLFGVLVLGQGLGLAWCLAPRVGLVGSLATATGLLLAAFLAALQRRRGKSVLPSWGNIALAFLVAVAVPTAALVLGPSVFRAFGGQTTALLDESAGPIEVVQAGLGGANPTYGLHGFTMSELTRWAWPELWVVLPLMAWGFLRSLRRGWKLRARGRVPSAWMLSIYALLAMAGACLAPSLSATSDYLTLASLAVILSIYGVADTVRGFMDKLVLAPPQEREE